MLRNAAALAALLACLPLAAAAQTAPVTVTVNGTAVAFDQPPVERVGRVYVPLRGVFEQLGASVVYDGGKIAATRGATTVALQIGSNSAIVNGAPVALDSPPFLIGARTLVPLRFVAQALGASVNYDGSTRTVAITQMPGGGGGRHHAGAAARVAGADRACSERDRARRAAADLRDVSACGRSEHGARSARRARRHAQSRT